MVQAALLSLFFPWPCLHESFESSFTVLSHESCANCTSALVGRDTHLWSPMLCKSASRPSKPLDAASRCDPPLHSVMCQDSFPTMHSLVRCQGKKRTNNLLPSQANTSPAGQAEEPVFICWIKFTPQSCLWMCIYYLAPRHSSLCPFQLLPNTCWFLANSGNFGKSLRKKKILCFHSLIWIQMMVLFMRIDRPVLRKYN